MKPLTHDQEMKLSELLFKILWPEKCWHVWSGKGWYPRGCVKKGCVANDAHPNPNLFYDWTGFGRVIEAIKKKLQSEYDENEDKEHFLEGSNLMSFHNEIGLELIRPSVFPYLLLKWLLEKDGRLGELEEVMEGEST